MFIGNSINAAARLQELSKTFAEYDVFLSYKTVSSLTRAMNKKSSAPDLANKGLVDLGELLVRSIGSMRIYSLRKADAGKFRTALEKSKLRRRDQRGHRQITREVS